ncbi:MAG: DUF4920 domain-containing protein [Capnocytophaga sp.]|nr:DUF4920 domain-containing protein [Capnocytophaga sp.]
MIQKIVFLLAFIVSSYGIFAQETPIKEAEVGVEYGAGVTDENSVERVYDTEMLASQLNESNPEMSDLIIKAKVTDVCPKRGCWITLENDANVLMFVKMKDYGFFLPNSIVGKTILLDGKATYKTTSVEKLQANAKKAKKSRKEIRAITEPRKEIHLLATGIRVVE